MVEAVNAKITPEMQMHIGGIKVYLHEMKYDYPSPGTVRTGLVFVLDTNTGLHFETIKWL